MLGKTLGMSSCGCWRTPWGALVLETMLGPASIGHRPAIRPRRCYCRRRGPTPLASRLRRPRWWGWASPGWCRLMRPPWKSWSPPTPREIRAPSSMRCPPRASRRRRRDRSAARADRRAARSTRHGRGPCSVPSRSPAPGCPWSPRVAGAASSCRRCCGRRASVRWGMGARWGVCKRWWVRSGVWVRGWVWASGGAWARGGVCGCAAHGGANAMHEPLCTHGSLPAGCSACSGAGAPRLFAAAGVAVVLEHHHRRLLLVRERLHRILDELARPPAGHTPNARAARSGAAVVQE